MEMVFGTVLALAFIALVVYIMGVMTIFCFGMVGGLLARPVLWLVSKVMGLFGVKWEFVPYSLVLVVGEGDAYVSREIWEGMPPRWDTFDDEWLIGTITVAIAWPYYAWLAISWLVRRLFYLST